MFYTVLGTKDLFTPDSCSEHTAASVQWQEQRWYTDVKNIYTHSALVKQ